MGVKLVILEEPKVTKSFWAWSLNTEEDRGGVPKVEAVKEAR